MAALFVLSAQPGLSISPDPGTDLPLRRVAHVVAYGILAVTLLRAFADQAPFQPLWAIGVSLLWAVSDELHQANVMSRSGAPEDVLIDGLGAVLGIALLGLVRRRREESRRFSRSRGR